jgi:hypothetical protein
MMESEVTSPFGPVPVPVLTVTVTAEELVSVPVKPLIDAVIFTVPAPTAVTRPAELTVATWLDPVLQVTRLVTSSVVEG